MTQKPTTPPPVIDVEASGFGAKSYPIEVGFVMPDGKTWCTLIVPMPDWTHWDESAEQVHGIARDLLDQYGRAANDVAQEMNRMLQGMTVYTDAWYQDFNWISRLFDAADTVPSFRLEDLRSLLDDDAAARWHATRDQVQSEMTTPRHRASNDAKVLQTTLVRVGGKGTK
jgi:hypothetical protein